MTTASVSIYTVLGAITVFAEDAAVVAVKWGRAAGEAPGPSVDRAVAELDRYFHGEAMTFTVAARPAGSAFQRRVWQRLQAVPWGATATYGSIAAELKTSARAVARACASNPIPIIIPCHRVVGAGGALCGYSGGDGAATKAALLALEGVLASARAALPVGPASAQGGQTS
jgi:methylated-DNA-[protein]-cysteine S-methyltransferase